MKKTLALLGALAATSCVDVETDPNETVGGASTAAVVEFDPGNSIIPFPNNLLLDRTTGKVTLPAQCGESTTAKLLRELVVNALDGFGTFKTAMRITFTKPVDPASLTDRIVMYRRATGATPADPAMEKDRAVPLVFIPGTTVRFNASCEDPKMIDSVTVVPARPLAARSTYTVAVLAGVKAADGSDFGASSTWGLVRLQDNPVTVENGVVVSERTPLNAGDAEDRATLLGLDLLWKAHAQALGFVGAVTGKDRTDVLLAWEFNTQTTTAPLDPAVAGTPAASAPKGPLTGVTAASADAVVDHMEATIRANFGAPAGVCTALGCASVGQALVGTLTAPNYQSPGANPLGTPPVPGPWSNPVSPIKISDATLEVRILTPAGARPATGWPTIVFGHGLGGNRLMSYLIGSQLARAGFATVAIDFVAHGTRAVRISNTGTCAGTPNPALLPQCFAPIFSTNLASTRDNVRQTVLDLQTLIYGVKACTPAAPCGTGGNTFAADATKIGYMGISLGGIIGSVVAATAPDLKASVLNVAAVGLVDVLENTENLTIRCSTVDGLIDAGIITGTKWDGAMAGTCVGTEWRTQPGYLTFSSIARWILDSSDGANYTSRLAARRFLLQKVVGDKVVPNVATESLARLTGMTMWAAGDTTPAAPPLPPSAAITATPKSNKWIEYTSTASFEFSHGSLLSGTTQPQQLALARIQTDAIVYLVNNILVP
jgi:dienelactone hydrolase